MSAPRYSVLLLAAVLWIGPAPVAEEDAPAYLGRPLAEVLQELNERGLDLVFSSAVVGEEMVVTVEPASTDLRTILDEILAPLGLEARPGPAGALLILPRPASPADAAGDRPKPRPLPTFMTEVVVTPGKHSVIQQEQASRLTVTNEDSVLVPSIGGDVSRILELLPGVAAPDNSAAFNVRGNLARDVSMVLDGLELYEPFHLQSFQSPFSFIDSKIVDRVDFLGGGWTADHGDRHGGVVEMTTRVPESPYRSQIELGSLNSRLAHGAPAGGGKGAWLVSARTWYPEALRDTIELGDTGLDPRFEDVYAKYSRTLSPRTLLSAHTLFAYDRLKYEEADGNEVADSKNSSTYLWMRALRTWTEKLDSETVLHVGRIRRFREGISEPEDEMIVVRDDRTVDFSGLKHHMTWRGSESHRIKAGAELRFLNADYDYVTGPPGETANVVLDPSGTSWALFAAHRARIGPRLATEVGARWDRQTFTSDSQFSPRLNAVWNNGKGTEIRLGMGKFYQSQRVHELRLEDGETSFHRAELSRQADATIQHRMDNGIRIRLDTYYRKLTGLHPRYENAFNALELYPETESDRIRVAPSRARLYGAEFLLRSDPRKPLSWWLSYARSTAEEYLDGRWARRKWDQTHAVKFLLGYRVQDRWWISLSGSGHTGWPTTPVTGEIVTDPDGSTDILVVPGDFNSARYPDYLRLDIKASRSFVIGKSRLRLDFEVVNLTDRKNVCCLDEVSFVQLPDGSLEDRSEFRYWLGITPSASILWEF